MLTVRDAEEEKVVALEMAQTTMSPALQHPRADCRIRTASARPGPPALKTRPSRSANCARAGRRHRHQARQSGALTPRSSRFSMPDEPRRTRNHLRALLTAVWRRLPRRVEYLRTFVRQLRKKIEDDLRSPLPAHDVYVGYRFADARCSSRRRGRRGERYAGRSVLNCIWRLANRARAAIRHSAAG